jgi:hypothetical protein
MTKLVTLFLLFFTILTAQDKQTYLSYPAAALANKSFEVSLITSTKYPGADKLEIIFHPDIYSESKIEHVEAAVKTFYGTTKISCTDDYHGYKAVIDLIENSLNRDMNYQVLFKIKPGNCSEVDLTFSGNFYKGDSLLGPLFENNGNTAEVSLYKPKKYAGKSLLINEGNIDFTLNLQHERITADFWFKTTAKDFSLLKITGNDDNLSELFINSFGMLSIQSSLQIQSLNPHFISRNSWNHILLHSDFEQGKHELYCNGLLVSSSLADVYFKPADLKFSFGGEGSKEFILEQLKFSAADEAGITRIMEGRNFNTPPDDIKLINIFRFDNENLKESNGNFSVAYNNIKFVKSDAPLSLRAPELNINLLSSSFELEWNEGDFRQAQQYVLERSEVNGSFVPVYSVGAENNPDAMYTYTDKITSRSDVIYYRVKQILKDGSAVYSSQVKVGQGFSEPFVLGQNFPNPFNPRTSIDIELYRDSDIEVVIFNLEGKEVSRLFNGNLSKGKHHFSFDASEYPSGVYICRVNTPDFSQTTKMILTK